MKRVIAILGVQVMIAAVMAHGISALHAKLTGAWILTSAIAII
jgi:hypothetical protein